jgi:hypothetical protein
MIGVQVATLAGEHDKHRRPDAGLRDVVNLHVVFPVQRFDKSIQLARGDAARSGFVGFLDQREQSVRACALLRRNKYDLRVLHELQMVADLFQKFLFVRFGDRVPFVDAQDHGASFFVRVAGDRRVERKEPLRSVEYQNRHVRHPQMPARHHDAQLFGHQFRLALATDARRIDENIIRSVVRHGFVHRIARGSGDGRDNRALHPGERIEQRGFPYIRSSDDRHLDGTHHLGSFFRLF